MRIAVEDGFDGWRGGKWRGRLVKVLDPRSRDFHNTKCGGKENIEADRQAGR